MDGREIHDAIIRILVNKLGVEEVDCVPTADIISDFGADSLDITELILDFEKEFDIKIPDHMIEGKRTIEDFENLTQLLVHRKIGLLG